MGGTVAQPLERLEDAAGIGRADDRAGAGHRQLAAARDGAGADPDVAAGEVVPDRVVDQVGDQPFGEYRIAADDGGFQGSVHAPVTRGGAVEDVFGGRGQVDLVADGEPALVACQQEQGADEVLGVIHLREEVGRHGAQVAGRAARAAQHDVDGGAHDR
jgi:hypothetical protein